MSRIPLPPVRFVVHQQAQENEVWETCSAARTEAVSGARAHAVAP